MNNPSKTITIYARLLTDKKPVDIQLGELRDYLNERNRASIKNTLIRVTLAAIPKGQPSTK